MNDVCDRLEEVGISQAIKYEGVTHMKVDELRKTLERYDVNVLKEIIVMLYKIIPKSRKENDGIDELINNFTKENKTAAKKEKPTDYLSLKAQIEQFLDYADQSFYFAPNRYVRKDQRSKWRFEVKRFIKQLLITGGENSEDAANLLAEIYAMLCYGCNYYIFNTDNPFASAGYKQRILLDLVLGKIFYNGYNKDSIKKAVYLTIDSNPDRETLMTYLLFTLAKMLKTPESKEMAIVNCVTFPKEYAEYQKSKACFKYSGRDDYRKGEAINDSAKLYLILKFELYEYDDGIEYFRRNYKARNKEIVLYCLLDFIDTYELNDLWLREYEKAVDKGIKPRDSLQNKYAERKA